MPPIHNWGESEAKLTGGKPAKQAYFACRMQVESSPRWGEGRVRGTAFYRNIIGYLSAMMESEAEGTPPF